MTAEPLTAIKGHCPICQGERNADVIAAHETRLDEDSGNIWTISTYRILKCKGCEAVFFQHDRFFSEGQTTAYDIETGEEISWHPHSITHWPLPTWRQQPDWSTDLAFVNWRLSGKGDLALLFDDIYTALDNNLLVLAAIGVRTIFDKASELLDVDQDLSFGGKIDQLHHLGKIGAEERETLKIFTDAGSAAAHRGWCPTPEAMDLLMRILEDFLYRSFVAPHHMADLSAKIPKRKAAKP